MKKSFVSCVVLVLCLVLWAGAVPAHAQLRVISANPVEAGLHELAERFERDTGNAVTVEAMGTGGINRLLASDEPADVIVGSTASVDQAVENGVVAGMRTPVGRVGIGIIVRSGGPVPNVATPEALRQAALDADGVVYNTAGSGQRVDRMFADMGIGDQVTPKSARPGNAGQTMARLMEGQGMEIGFGLLSEIQPYEGNGIQLIGRLPEELQTYSEFDGIVLSRSAAREVAREFIDYITAPAAREVFAATGVD